MAALNFLRIAGIAYDRSVRMGTFSVYFDLGNASAVEGALGRAFDRILPAFAFHLLRLWLHADGATLAAMLDLEQDVSFGLA